MKTNPPVNNLRAWRLHRGLTQEQLAEQIGTTKAMIGHLETGERGLSERWLRRLGPALGTTPGTILDYTPDEPQAAIASIWMRIPPAQRGLAREVLERFADVPATASE